MSIMNIFICDDGSVKLIDFGNAHVGTEDNHEIDMEKYGYEKLTDFSTSVEFKDLFLDNTKNYYLPKISQDSSLTFHPYRQGDNLEQNKYGIFEPISERLWFA